MIKLSYKTNLVVKEQMRLDLVEQGSFRRASHEESCDNFSVNFWVSQNELLPSSISRPHVRSVFIARPPDDAALV